MKSNVSENPCSKNTYPGLYVMPNGQVVLMTSKTKGTYVGKTRNCTYPYEMGHYSDDWSPDSKPFTGSVCLEND